MVAKPDSILSLPVQNGDLLELGMRRSEVPRVLELLHQRWEESGCRLDKRQLIDSLYSED